MEKCNNCIDTTDRIEELEGFVRYRDNLIEKQTVHMIALFKELSAENSRVAVRLDACLYSMVLMQAIIRDQRPKEPKESVSLAT